MYYPNEDRINQWKEQVDFANRKRKAFFIGKAILVAIGVMYLSYMFAGFFVASAAGGTESSQGLLRSSIALCGFAVTFGAFIVWLLAKPNKRLYQLLVPCTQHLSSMRRQNTFERKTALITYSFLAISLNKRNINKYLGIDSQTLNESTFLVIYIFVFYYVHFLRLGPGGAIYDLDPASEPVSWVFRPESMASSLEDMRRGLIASKAVDDKALNPLLQGINRQFGLVMFEITLADQRAACFELLSAVMGLGDYELEEIRKHVFQMMY